MVSERWGANGLFTKALAGATLRRHWIVLFLPLDRTIQVTQGSLRFGRIFALSAAVMPPAPSRGQAVPLRRRDVIVVAPLSRRRRLPSSTSTAQDRPDRQFSPMFDEPFFRRFFGEGCRARVGGAAERVQNSWGRRHRRYGGVIVTNHHVIDGADVVTVVLATPRVRGDPRRTETHRSGGAAGSMPRRALPFLNFAIPTRSRSVTGAGHRQSVRGRPT